MTTILNTNAAEDYVKELLAAVSYRPGLDRRDLLVAFRKDINAGYGEEVYEAINRYLCENNGLHASDASAPRSPTQ